jgi:hypothetical protein
VKVDVFATIGVGLGVNVAVKGTGGMGVEVWVDRVVSVGVSVRLEGDDGIAGAEGTTKRF